MATDNQQIGTKQTTAAQIQQSSHLNLGFSS